MRVFRPLIPVLLGFAALIISTVSFYNVYFSNAMVRELALQLVSCREHGMREASFSVPR